MRKSIPRKIRNPSTGTALKREIRKPTPDLFKTVGAINRADIASQNEETFRQHLITNHREKELPVNRRYYNCEGPTEGNFCCKECQEDWEKRKYFDSQRRIE